jgi:hypothetical protein
MLINIFLFSRFFYLFENYFSRLSKYPLLSDWSSKKKWFVLHSLLIVGLALCVFVDMSPAVWTWT